MLLIYAEFHSIPMTEFFFFFFFFWSLKLIVFMDILVVEIIVKYGYWDYFYGFQ